MTSLNDASLITKDSIKNSILFINYRMCFWYIFNFLHSAINNFLNMPHQKIMIKVNYYTFILRNKWAIIIMIMYNYAKLFGERM